MQADKYIPELNHQLAAVIAKFHSLEMPFSKKPTFLFETAEK